MIRCIPDRKADGTAQGADRTVWTVQRFGQSFVPARPVPLIAVSKVKDHPRRQTQRCIQAAEDPAALLSC